MNDVCAECPARGGLVLHYSIAAIPLAVQPHSVVGIGLRGEAPEMELSLRHNDIIAISTSPHHPVPCTRCKVQVYLNSLSSCDQLSRIFQLK
jgi:hypothetical protein